MKNKLKIIAVLVSICIFFSSAGMSMRMQGLNPAENRPLDDNNQPSENTGETVVVEPTQHRDSVNYEKVEKQKPEPMAPTDPVIKQESAKDEENDDEGHSILSFNFIYYMIHKFKFSDLITPQ